MELFNQLRKALIFLVYITTNVALVYFVKVQPKFDQTMSFLLFPQLSSLQELSSNFQLSSFSESKIASAILSVHISD